MLERPGDLIPVQRNATNIPWTKRRSQILNFLHRGPVSFSTLVYDTNVGDISSLATYFNPERISEKELNLRFGHCPTSSGGKKPTSPLRSGSVSGAVKPRLLLYPDHGANTTHQRTLNWILNQESKSAVSDGNSSPDSSEEAIITRTQHTAPGQPILMGLRPAVSDLALYPPSTGLGTSEDLSSPVNTSLPPSPSKPKDEFPLHCLASKSVTLPTISLSTALDSLWVGKAVDDLDLDSLLAEKGGLGLGGLVNSVDESAEVLDMLETSERCWGTWENALAW